LNPKNKLIVFGAGGHGKVVADTALRAGFDVAGFLDDSASAPGSTVIGLPVLGNREWLRSTVPFRYSIAVAIGNNRARMELAEWLTSRHIELATIVSPLAMVASSARIARGTVVMAGVVVSADAIVGKGCILNSASVIEHDVVLGHYVHISPNAALGGEAKVGDFTHVGIGAAVLPRISIGEGSMIGAGSVVSRNIPDQVIAYGSPARTQRSNDGSRHYGPAPALRKGGNR
jgi:sugar O-acyltransferase (sialic acid O-acetyltransferase NeuD family)